MTDTLISTPRLNLLLMPDSILEACLEDATVKAESLLEIKIDPAWFEEKNLMSLRLNQCREDAIYKMWSLRAIVLKATREMVGHIGFHTSPNPDYLRSFVAEGVEFGYTIFPTYRRQGFAYEAIKGVMDWATERQGVTNFIVSVSPNNIPSVRLAHKLGFVKIGEHIDEEDGLEEIYVLS